MTALTNTPLRVHPDLKLIASGKVREVYELDADHLLFVATDRVSAFDCVMANGIPGKGELLSMLSRWWFNFFKREMPELKTHFVSMGLPERLKKELSGDEVAAMQHRTMVTRKLEVFKIEAIVRGYLTGSAYASYKKDGAVNGSKLPEGLLVNSHLDRPLYTPSTKADPGEYDENISEERAAEIVGPEYAHQIKSLSLQIYQRAAEYTATKGILLADTKFEFGLDKSTTPPSVVLIDEVLTPDSSRFWSADKFEPGRPQDSFDKQALRDWLVQTGQKEKEGVEMPTEVVKFTEQKYHVAFETITGRSFGGSR